MPGLEQINITAEIPSQTINLRANTANQIAFTSTALPSGPRGLPGGVDATPTIKGNVKLAGDLSGTADLPTVPGLLTLDTRLDSVESVTDLPDDITDLNATLTTLLTHIPSTLGTGTNQNYRMPTPDEAAAVVKGLRLIAREMGKKYADIDVSDATTLLSGYGFTVTSGFDQTGLFPYVLVQAEYTYPSSSNYRAWGNYFFNMSAPLATVIEAPHPQTDGNSENIALNVWREIPGALYVMSSVNRKARDYMLTEISTDHTGGTYTLNVLGLGNTGSIAYNASISTVQTAIEAVVGVGKVVVTGDPANTSLHTFVNLSGDLYDSGNPTNTITVNSNSLTGGTFLTLDHDADAAHNYNSIFNKAASAFATQGYSQLQLHGFSDTSSGVPRIFSAILSKGSSNDTKLTNVVKSALEAQGLDVGTRDSFDTQGIYFTGAPTGGTFTLTCDSQTTGAITYSTTQSTLASNIQTALEALTSIRSGNVSVTISQNNNGSIPAFVITFKGTLYHAGKQVTVASNSLTGGTSPTPVMLTANGTALTAESNTQGDIAELNGTVFQHLEMSATVRNSAALSAKVVSALAKLNLPQLSAAAIPALAEAGHASSQAPLVNGSGATIGTSSVAARSDHRHPATSNTPTEGDYIRRGSASWVAVSSNQIRTDLAPRVVSLTDAATITPNSATTDLGAVTLGGNRTMAAPTGSPVTGQLLTLRVRQDATGSRTLTWDSIYRFSGGVAPTLTTTAGKVDYIQFVYNNTDTKWDCINTKMDF